MKTKNSNDEYNQFREMISKLDPCDFGGHTCFKELTPEQRLDWLAELVVFVYESRNHKKYLYK
ncbi:MAG: hypothetical protein FWH53_09195 [Leptospirales bacterium]|nr:hypothetical protein [Leptospirales bacterium]